MRAGALRAQIRVAGEGSGHTVSGAFSCVEPVALGRVDASTYGVMLIRPRRQSQSNCGAACIEQVQQSELSKSQCSRERKQWWMRAAGAKSRNPLDSMSAESDLGGRGRTRVCWALDSLRKILVVGLTDPPGFVVRQDREHPYFPRLRISRAEAHDPGVVRTHPSLCPSTR